MHRSHDVFVLWKQRTAWRCGRADGAYLDGCLTFWQQSMNSSMVTTPSLFLSIFCWRQKTEQIKTLARPPLTWRAFPVHLPGRRPPRAAGASPPWGPGMCISPSCRRWPSWCPASPETVCSNTGSLASRPISQDHSDELGFFSCCAQIFGKWMRSNLPLEKYSLWKFPQTNGDAVG